MIKHFFISIISFLVLDSIWFAVFMKSFAKDELRGFLRFSGENIDLNYPATVIAYICMGLSVSLFLMPAINGGSFLKTAILSAVMGFIIFGVFDFTNLALFKGYPVKFAIVDVLWGTFMYCLVGIINTYVDQI